VYHSSPRICGFIISGARSNSRSTVAKEFMMQMMQRRFELLSQVESQQPTQRFATARLGLQLAIFLGILSFALASPCTASGEATAGPTELAQTSEVEQVPAVSGDESGLSEIFQPLAKHQPPNASACESPNVETNIGDCVQNGKVVIGEGGTKEKKNFRTIDCTATVLLKFSFETGEPIVINLYVVRAFRTSSRWN